MTWRVQAEPILWIGGLRALFLQALHPLAMAGVAQHSSFRDDPWGRLRRTAEFVGVVTYGTTDEAIAAGQMVRRAHRGLRGVEPESGEPYVVADARLLLWVHCCQVECFLSTVQRAGLGLTTDEADRYVAEQVAAADAGRDPGAGWSRPTWPSLAAYFERRPARAAGDRGGAGRRTVPARPADPGTRHDAAVARPAWALLAGLAFASQPPWARRMYGLPGIRPVDLTIVAVEPRLARLRTLPRPGGPARTTAPRWPTAAPAPPLPREGQGLGALTLSTPGRCRR